MSRQVLIVGGGVAALELVLALRKVDGERFEMRVVSPDRHFVYRPMAVAEPFGLGEARRFDLDRLLASRGVGRHEAVVTAVDPDAHTVKTGAGEEMGYDVLVVAAGARPFEAIPGALTLAMGDGFTRFGAMLKRLGDGDRLVVAIPGGSAWTLPAYETALMARVAHPDLAVTIVTPEHRPLAVFGRNASAAVAELLAEREIEFLPESHCAAVEHDGLHLVGAPPVEGALIVAMPGLVGPSLEGLPHDAHGFIPVDSYCRVTGVEDVYAAGDVTTFPIKQGGLAAQHAVVAAKSIAAGFGLPVAAAPFRPVLRGLLLTGGYPEYLRADIALGMGVHHSEVDMEPIWWPPSKIATEHLSQFLALIAAAEPLPGEDPFLRVETDDIGDVVRTSPGAA